MIEKEKVTKGLECCKLYNKDNCGECPYDYNGRGNSKNECIAELATNVLSLLKKKEQLLSKIVGMFRSYNGDSFLNYDSSDVICGPNDRALYGFDTIFPIDWLVEDFGFTKEEARAFIDMVHLKDKGRN